MQIIPVLDLMHGTVVRGIAGERDSYQPVKSVLTGSADALDIATAIRDEFGFDQMYVADLDAIVFGKPNHSTIRKLAEHGFRLLLDTGIRSMADVESAHRQPVDAVVVALESIASQDLVVAAVDRCGADRTVFSVDLQRGRPLTRISAWKDMNPLSIIQYVVELGVERLILLDLAAVGMGAGIPTLQLCRAVKSRHPNLQIVTGGGVDSLNDLPAAREAGVDGLLIASALHDGRITAEALRSFDR